MLSLTERELFLAWLAIAIRLDELRHTEPKLYQECRALMRKLWQMQFDARLASGETPQPPINEH